MEEYLHHMKTLRSQMNEVEDQAAKISVEEQTHITTIQTLEKDLASAKSEIKRLKEDTEQMMKERGEICSQILEKQRKIAVLDSDSHTLAQFKACAMQSQVIDSVQLSILNMQTLELIKQERVSLSARLVEKSAYYTKVADDINSKLQQQQVIGSTRTELVEKGESMDCYDYVTSCPSLGYVTSCPGSGVSITFISYSTFLAGKCAIDNHLIMDNLGNDAEKNLIAKLDSAKSKLAKMAQMKSKLVTENNKVACLSKFSCAQIYASHDTSIYWMMKQYIEQLKCSAKDFKTELMEMDIKTLEVEYEALLSDKAGEMDYLQSLQKQIKQLKGLILLDELVVKEVAKAGFSLGKGPHMMGTECLRLWNSSARLQLFETLFTMSVISLGLIFHIRSNVHVEWNTRWQWSFVHDVIKDMNHG
ncbi:hypothetical protein SADUNF_Sadunf13G0076400 [Salix dunnii]|uniref:Uncharacterized protein n=1 Tax=Salix dunnii TaxID=1413687 RepID=A0A835JL93_9ROSI|nr:hypothetical protein SADUNF_Sadunf13G0076400 [Salix dunnii]